jgi:hypothetical protein
MLYTIYGFHSFGHIFTQKREISCAFALRKHEILHELLYSFGWFPHKHMLFSKAWAFSAFTGLAFFLVHLKSSRFANVTLVSSELKGRGFLNDWKYRVGKGCFYLYRDQFLYKLFHYFVSSGVAMSELSNSIKKHILKSCETIPLRPIKKDNGSKIVKFFVK